MRVDAYFIIGLFIGCWLYFRCRMLINDIKEWLRKEKIFRAREDAEEELLKRINRRKE